MTRSDTGAERRAFRTFLVLFFLLAATLLAGGAAFAAQVTLAWDENMEPDLAGYRVYYGTASGVYTEVVDVGLATTLTMGGFEEGTDYYFAATAYDTSGDESGFSEEVAFQAAPSAAVLFSDDFSDGDRSGDPDWEQQSGGWSVNGLGQYVTAADLGNRALVADPAVGDFAAGTVEARVKLSSSFRAAANAYLIFGWEGPGLYRYVRLRTSGVTIGQVGNTVEELKGTKARNGSRLRTGRWIHVRAEIGENGAVAVYLDHAEVPALSYDFAAPARGRVGLATKQAKSSFDDYVVRGVALP